MTKRVVYSLIGWFYLWIRYHNKGKVNKILLEEYDNSYFNAGALVSMRIFAIILIVLISLLIVAVIGRIIYDLF